jgi:hypothetical protein
MAEIDEQPFRIRCPNFGKVMSRILLTLIILLLLVSACAPQAAPVPEARPGDRAAAGWLHSQCAVCTAVCGHAQRLLP